MYSWATVATHYRVQREVQRIEEGKLDQQRQASLHRVHPVGLVERLLLGHQALWIAAMLCLQFLELWRQLLHRLARPQLRARQGDQRTTNEQGKQDDGNAEVWDEVIDEHQ